MDSYTALAGASGLISGSGLGFWFFKLAVSRYLKSEDEFKRTIYKSLESIRHDLQHKIDRHDKEIDSLREWRHDELNPRLSKLTVAVLEAQDRLGIISKLV